MTQPHTEFQERKDEEMSRDLSTKTSTSITVAEYLGLLHQEYSSLISKLNSKESWAYGFVALYFAFLASISAVSGVIISELIAFSSAVPSLPQTTEIYRLKLILEAIALISIMLNAWACFMLLNYMRSAQNILGRLGRIEEILEKYLAGFDEQVFGFANNHVATIWSRNSLIVAKLLIVSVMILLCVPWISILTRSF